MEYEKKVIAYIDLLGFKNFINFTDKSANRSDNKIDRINNLFTLINELTENKNYSNTCSRQVTQFSDLIVISFAADDSESFVDELGDIQLLCVNCINQGFLVRGSIVYGNIVHTDKVIFGAGLVEAYEAEREKAKYPRILIDEAIIRDCKDVKPGILNIEGVASIDNDGLYYVDYFMKAGGCLDDTKDEYDRHIKSIAKIIKDISESPILREKAIWLFDKFKPMLKHYPLFKDDDVESYEFNDFKDIYSALDI